MTFAETYISLRPDVGVAFDRNKKTVTFTSPTEEGTERLWCAFIDDGYNLSPTNFKALKDLPR